MTEPISPTHEYLLSHYGPLLTIKHVAEILHTTPNGVRMAIARRNQPFSVALSRARRRFGRRVYFEAQRIAEAIDQTDRKHQPSDQLTDAEQSPTVTTHLSLAHGPHT